jgi:hypothetical protein
VTDHVLFQAGAKLHPTLEPAHIVVGIKETPLNELVTSPVSAPGLRSGLSIPRTHLMFSHTTKGQPYNMELLSRFLGSREDALLPRLIDYELLVGEDGKRTVGFGWFAGGKQQLKTIGNDSPSNSCWCPRVFVCTCSCASRTWSCFSFPCECRYTFCNPNPSTVNPNLPQSLLLAHASSTHTSIHSIAPFCTPKYWPGHCR